MGIKLCYKQDKRLIKNFQNYYRLSHLVRILYGLEFSDFQSMGINIYDEANSNKRVRRFHRFLDNKMPLNGLYLHQHVNKYNKENGTLFRVNPPKFTGLMSTLQD